MRENGEKQIINFGISFQLEVTRQASGDEAKVLSNESAGFFRPDTAGDVSKAASKKKPSFIVPFFKRFLCTTGQGGNFCFRGLLTVIAGRFVSPDFQTRCRRRFYAQTRSCSRGFMRIVLFRSILRQILFLCFIVSLCLCEIAEEKKAKDEESKLAFE